MSVGSGSVGVGVAAKEGRATGVWGSPWRRPLAALLVLLAAMFAGALTTTANAVTCSGTGPTVYTNQTQFMVFSINDATTPQAQPGQCARSGSFSYSGRVIYLHLYTAAGGDYAIYAVAYESGAYFPTTLNVSPALGFTTTANYHQRRPSEGPYPPGTYDFTITYAYGGDTLVARANVTFSGTGSYSINAASAEGGVFGAASLPPSLSSISPAAGPLAGGQSFTLTGANLTGATALTIGGVAATSRTVVNDTTITATTPAGTAGAKNVVVTTPSGSATLASGYTYVSAPTLAGRSPTSGPAAGGTTVFISGTNFTPVTSVTFNGVPGAGLNIVSSTQLSVVSPPGAPGEAAVAVISPGGSASDPDFFEYVAAPTISAINPASGPVAGGTAITVTGSGFAAYNTTTVTIGGVTIPGGSVTVNSATSLTFTAPANVAGPVNVVVTTPGGSATQAGGYTYVAAPSLASVSPSAGPIAGGNLITLSGSNFAFPATVTVGGAPVTALTLVNSSTLTGVAPSGAAGAKNVVITTPGGSATLANGYTHVAAPTLTHVAPSGGPTAGGNLVEVNGANLTGATSVTFDGAAATNLTQVSSTRVTVNAPPGAAGPANIAITTPGGTATLANGFTYFAPPTLASVSPSSGPASGGQQVILTGTNFDTVANGVKFGAQNVPYTINSPTQITATTPAASAGIVDVSVGDSYYGVATLAAAYTFVAPPTASALSPAFGPTAGGTVVTVSGSGFVPGGTAVTLGGTVIPASSVSVNSPASLTFTTPAHAAGNLAVSVTTTGGASGDIPGGFTYADAPTATSRTPGGGPIAGGTVVTITGANFAPGDTAVTIGGAVVPASSVTVNSPTSLTFTTPAHAAGAVALSVTTSGGTSGDIPGGFLYAAPPTVTAVTPQAGPLAGGTTLTISGANLIGVSAVTIGGAAATNIVEISPTQLSVIAPSGSAGFKDVAVTALGGQAALTGGYRYVPAPTLASVSPAAGPVSGGTTLSVAGANFDSGDLAATLGGVAATNVQVHSSTLLTLTAPAHAAGAVDLAVTLTGGNATLASAYTYLDAPTVAGLSPAAGPLAGGTAVTVTGANFNPGDTSVTIGGSTIPAGSVTVNSATSLTFTTPAHAAGTVAVSVTTSGGTSGDVPGGFTYLGAPSVASVAPNAGPPSGGQTVILTGANFTSVTAVTFDGAPSTFTVDSASQITAVTPSGSVGPADVTVTTPGGSGTLAAGYTYGVPVLALTAGDLAIEGGEGGAGGWTVTSATAAYTVSNSGSDTLNWSATLPSFLSPASPSGTLAPSSDFTFTPTPNATASTLTPGIYTGVISVISNGGDQTRAVTLTVRDITSPILVGVPADITQTIVAPAASAAVTWTPPTATDNMPGVTVSQIAGPAPGAQFPLGATIVTYRAADSGGNSVDASFTVTVNQIAQGTLTLNVETGEDGTFTFSSSAPGLTAAITTSGGFGAAGPITLPAGDYSLSFTVPAGFAVTSAVCTAGSTLNAATRSGAITIAPATSTVCTIQTQDALGETAAALGAHLETRAALIIQNAPEVSRRLDRLTGTGGGAGGVSGFGVTMGAGVLPFSMNLAADEVQFSMSLLRASRMAGGNSNAALRGETRHPYAMPDPLGDALFGVASGRIIAEPPGAAVGAAPGDGLPDADPMASRFDIWLEGRFARFDSVGGDGHFGILHVGADYLVTPHLLVGAGFQFDWLSEDTPMGGEIESQGFLAGPYLTARLSQNLYLDLRAAWGTADTDISPFGTYVDAVESERRLITAALIGDFNAGDWQIRPEARLAWYREETDSYVDSLNVDIPGFIVETGYLEFGPEFSYVIELEGGATLLPSLTLQGVWTFEQENSAAAPSNAPGLADTGLRGRIELGLGYAEPGFSVSAAAFYDGVGGADFDAWGARMKLSLGF